MSDGTENESNPTVVNQAPDEPVNEPAQAQDMNQPRTPGQILLAARKESNITLEYVAGELRLSQKLIESIEVDQTEGLPGSTYVRGYIRSYARLLGLDEEMVLENYRADTGDDDEWAANIPGEAGQGLVKQRTRTGIASPFTFTAFAVIIGFLAWFAWDQDWFQLRQDSITPPNVEVEQENNNNIAETEAARAAQGDASVIDVSATALSSSSEPSAIAREPSISADAAVPDEEVELTFEFTGTSWVDVRDRTDRRLIFKSYTAGEYESVSGLKPFRVFIGNATAVRMTYAGRDYDVLPHRNGIYAKFEIGEAEESLTE
jgi:cytoskeleton protein RodZ